MAKDEARRSLPWAPDLGFSTDRVRCGEGGRDNHKMILERELETVGLRLNKRPPNITLTKKATGGVKFNATVPLTKLGRRPGKDGAANPEGVQAAQRRGLDAGGLLDG